MKFHKKLSAISLGQGQVRPQWMGLEAVDSVTVG